MGSQSNNSSNEDTAEFGATRIALLGLIHKMDIRSFFGPKGGAAPAKPAPKKAEEEPSKRRTSTYCVLRTPLISNVVEVGSDWIIIEGRKVLEDSDDEEPVQ